MKQQIQELMNKPMKRKDFLRYTGSVVLTLIGVSGVLKTILHHDSVSNKRQGYGSSRYGV